MGKRLIEVLGNINIVGEGYKRKFMQVEMFKIIIINYWIDVMFLNLVSCSIIILNKSCKELFKKS